MINKYRSRLNFLLNHIDKFINPEAKEIIKDKITGIVSIDPTKKEQGRWKFVISPEFPINFLPCKIKGNNVQVDFSCHIEGIIPCLKSKIKSENLINKYNVLIRVWSLDDKLSFRSELDSEIIKDLICENDNKRVITRFHLDKRAPNARIKEPLYHMHFGGVSNENELCWYPKSIDVPRFQHFPFDIILASEFILSNFFSIESYSVREDPEWKSIVHSAQELFIKPCIDEYYKFINNESDTFLNQTCNWN